MWRIVAVCLAAVVAAFAACAALAWGVSYVLAKAEDEADDSFDFIADLTEEH